MPFSIDHTDPACRSVVRSTGLNLEDETGMLNIICTLGLFLRTKRIVAMSPALLIRGVVERGDGGVISLLADKLEPLDLKVAHSSRDFR